MTQYRNVTYKVRSRRKNWPWMRNLKRNGYPISSEKPKDTSEGNLKALSCLVKIRLLCFCLCCARAFEVSCGKTLSQVVGPVFSSGGIPVVFRWPIKCWNVVKSSQFNGQAKLFLKCRVYMTCSPFTKVTQLWGCCRHDT